MNAGRDDDQTWSELVHAFHTDPDPGESGHAWPAAEDIDPDDDNGQDAAETYPGASHTWSSAPAAQSGRPAGTSAESEAAEPRYDDDHFVPPNPPPLPKGDRITRWAWAGLAATPSVLLISALTGWTPPDSVMVVLVGGFIAGFVTLVVRMRGRNPHDPDDGAIV